MNFHLEYEAPIIIWQLKGLIEDNEFNSTLAKRTFADGVNIFKGSGQKEIKWLNDTAELENIGPEIQHWLDSEMNRKIIKEQIHGKLAFLEPIDTHGKECVRLYIAGARYYFNKARLYFEFATFKHKAEAFEWLKQPLRSLQVA